MKITKKAEPTKAEREAERTEQIAEAYRALGLEQGWPSVSLETGLGLNPGPGLPPDLPARPQIASPPAEVVAARAKAASLAGECAQLETDLTAAYDAGDYDAVIAVRRALVEAPVKAWAAQRDAATAELAHYEAESARIQGFTEAHYAKPLDALRAEIRRLQGGEQPLLEAIAGVHHSIGVCDQAATRLQKELDGLRRGPSRPAAGRKDGWVD